MRVNIVVAWDLEDLTVYVLTEEAYQHLPDGDSVGPVLDASFKSFSSVRLFYDWAVANKVEIADEDQMVSY